jgi:hypothetical protein
MLGPPVFRIDLVGYGADQLGCKNKTVRHLRLHALHSICLRHLIPGVIEFYGVKALGVIGQHIFCGDAGRINAGIDPLGKRVAAGAHIQAAGCFRICWDRCHGLYNTIAWHNGSSIHNVSTNNGLMRLIFPQFIEITFAVSFLSFIFPKNVMILRPLKSAQPQHSCHQSQIKLP